MCKYSRLVAAVACALALFLTGCAARGAPTAQAAAATFLTAAASGDLAQAQAVADRPVAASDLATLRAALFSQDATLVVTDLGFIGGFEFEGERLQTTYLTLSSYRSRDGKWPPSDDPAAASNWGLRCEDHMMGMRKQGSGWFVVTWTGPEGVAY